jgi:hypothetical protein
MLLGLFVLLVILWLAGFVAFHIAGGVIHLLLVIAVIALVAHFLTQRTTTRSVNP